jgi:hypothetical protein
VNNENYKIVQFEKFYKAHQPNITTTKNGVIYFNSSDSEEDNAFHSKLQDAYRKSAVHSNFINLKSNLTYGSGLFPVDESNTSLTEFVNAENRSGQSLDDVFMKASFDMSMYEAACFQVVYNGEGKIAEVYHTSPANIRAEEPDDFGKVNNWYFSNTWGDITNKKDKRKANNVSEATVIPTFDPASGKRDGRQLLYVRRYTSTNDIYPQPQYVASLNFIQLEHVLSEYIVNKISGGYYPSGIFYLNSSMSDEQKDSFIREFRRKHEGAENAGKIVFIFGDTATAKPEFLKLNDDLGNSLVKEYISTSQLQIAISHGGSLSLLGIDYGDSFGQNADASKINISRLYFIDTVIKNYQNLLLKGINKMLAVNQLGSVTVNNDSLKIQQPPVDVSDLTVDERREIVYGLPPMAKASTEPTNNLNPEMKAV